LPEEAPNWQAGACGPSGARNRRTLTLFLKLRDLSELRLLTAALIAERPELSPAEAEALPAETMDPLINRLLQAAETQGFGHEAGLALETAERDRLLAAVERQLDLAAEQGELFLVGDLEAVLRKLGQGT